MLHRTIAMTTLAAAAANPPLRLPSRALAADGRMRRLGVEPEFTGLTLERIATVIQARLGGTIEARSAYEYMLRATRLGDFAVELDYAYLKRRGRQDDDKGVLGAVARRLVPLEVVAPPLALDRVHELHPLLADLRASLRRARTIACS